MPVFDNFESYPPGTSIDGNDGGSNWGGSWDGAGGQSIIDTSANRLEFLASNGLSIRSDTTLEITGNNNRIATRPLSGSFDGDDTYLSMLVRFQGTPGNNDFLVFWLQNPDFGDSPQFGIKVNEGGGGARDFFIRLDRDANYSTEFEPGQTYLLVARFSKNSQDYYEQGRLWVNPQCTDSPPPTASANILSNPASKVSEVTELGLRSENISGDASVQVGQVAAGEQWSDVVRCECFQNGLEATFYNNYDSADPFPETPDLTRLDPTINFNWGNGSPDPAINDNQFAVQWQGTIEVPETGNYEFIARTDDGVRLWVDNLDDPLIDDWNDRAVDESSETITLQAGQRYGIRMQYYENGGQAEARLRWRRPDGTEEIIPEEFLFGCLPVASPVLESASAICGSSDLVELTFTQSDRSRPLLQSSLENTSFYSVESVAGGETFNVIDANAGANGYSVVLQLDSDLDRESTYRVNVADVQDVGGSVIDPNPSEFEFAAAGDGLITEYWNNRNLAGAPELTGLSDQILFDWGSGSPVPGTINADRFSVRWTGFIVPPETGNYVFRTRTDDGVRLYVNDLSAPMINEWRDQSPTNHDSGTVYLEEGRSYSFRMEMYENQGGAVAQLRWNRPGPGGFEVVPESAFFSCPDTGKVLDHFRISHGGLGVTCQPSLVSFEARDTAGDLLTDFDGQVQLSTSTGDGFWQDAGSSTGSLSIVPGDSGQASYQFTPADGGVVTFGLRHTQAATVNLGITDGDVSELPSADPDIVFQEAGFIFHRASDFAQPIPTQVSGRPSSAAPGAQDLRLTAVRENDKTGACEAFLVGEQSVTVGSVCESPGSCALDNALEVNGSNVASNSAGNTGNASTVNMDFGDESTSSAPLSLRYPDAGRISLFARAPLVDDQGTPTGEFIAGSSGLFTVVPAGFCLEPVSSLLQCATVDAECSVGAAAGEVFAMRLAAVNWTEDGETNAEFCGNPVTPNFAHSGLEITSQLLAPASGDVGEMLTENADILPSDEGAAQFNQSVSEVGVFDFAMTPGSPYFGETLPGTNSAPVGRFTPASFGVSLSDAGGLGAACTGTPGFTYTGQTFDWLMEPEVRITPLAADGTSTTGNYLIGAFNKLTVSGISRTDPERDQVRRLVDDSDFVEVDYDSAPGVLSSDMTEQAIFYRYSDAERFEMIKSVNSRTEPFFPVLAFEIDSVVDDDGISALPASDPLLNFQPAAAGDIRYGRLEMSNVYGPETADSLSMPFRVTYWDGNRFTLNSTDSCTPWNKTVPSPLANDQTFHDLADEGDEGIFDSGIGQPLTLEPKGNRGEERIVWEMPIWLQSDWSENGVLENPSALATFGVYRGHDRIIYWREVSE
ncbi:DUF6701 domain-containing protein [Marinobacter sp. ATCH36]|uniref:DUF6701 domain-containing protein n=1 Tax=Marinobacter sp. ATCH36 TaxID=2945106 RepID=UPI002020A189|nr:DUF6701 domain-containing protein [Marinobacter sp. ATCH36]MCL7945984.1 PA14 domain-containing protein [Marinobacter sp. ATCH36]